MKKKLAAVWRLMRGESLEALSRELNVPAHRLSEWRDRALITAEGALRERERDARDETAARRVRRIMKVHDLRLTGPRQGRRIPMTGRS